MRRTSVDREEMWRQVVEDLTSKKEHVVAATNGVHEGRGFGVLVAGERALSFYSYFWIRREKRWAAGWTFIASYQHILDVGIQRAGTDGYRVVVLDNRGERIRFSVSGAAAEQVIATVAIKTMYGYIDVDGRLKELGDPGDVEAVMSRMNVPTTPPPGGLAATRPDLFDRYRDEVDACRELDPQLDESALLAIGPLSVDVGYPASTYTLQGTALLTNAELVLLWKRLQNAPWSALRVSHDQVKALRPDPAMRAAFRVSWGDFTQLDSASAPMLTAPAYLLYATLPRGEPERCSDSLTVAATYAALLSSRLP